MQTVINKIKNMSQHQIKAAGKPATAFIAGMLLLGNFPPPAVAQEYTRGEDAESFFRGVSNAEKQKIVEALPRTAHVSPEKPGKLLVFNLHIRDKKVVEGHSSIPYGNYAIYQMGKRTGAWETFFSRDTLMFGREALEPFDAVCFNNTGGVLCEDPVLRRNLLEYVHSGKGFAGVHAAAATFVQFPVYDQFPQYGVMLGGYENYGHPWAPDEQVILQVNETDHPVNSAFESKNFAIRDEIYQYCDPYSRDILRVLVSVDPEKTDMGPERYIYAPRRIDKNIAVSWVKAYGKGRVFFSALGHNPHIFWNSLVMEHFYDGIQFSLGDLAGSVVPGNKMDPAVRARENLGWRFGINSYCFREGTLFEAIDKTAALGSFYMTGYNFQKVSDEIGKEFDHHLTGEERLAVMTKLAEEGVRLVEYYIHRLPEDREECRKIFEFAHAMGVETIVGEPAEERLDMAEALCEKFDMRLAIHNHQKDLSPVYWDPEGILEVCDGRSTRIGACGDIGFWIRSGIDPEKAVRKLGDRLISLHVHDLNEKSPEGHDVAWGEGVVDFRALLETLHEMNLPVFYGLEYTRQEGNAFGAIRDSMDHFDRICMELAGKTSITDPAASR